MYLDLHTHSVSSDDSRATVKQYTNWVDVLRGRGYRIDGFVLTEHRRFDFDRDYSQLSSDKEVLILKGSELDTDRGHFLVYGVTVELTQCIDFSNVELEATELLQAAHDCGAVAVPAHPGRFGVGLWEFVEKGAGLDGIVAVERLNGGDRPGEAERAEALIEQHGLTGTGGSDAHLASALGTCMTRFETAIAHESELVRELKAGNFRAVRLEETAFL